MGNKERIKSYVSLCIWFWFALADVRLIEILFVTYFGDNFLIHLYNNVLGFCFDTVYWFFILSFAYVIYILGAKYFKNTILLVFRIILTLILYISIGLVLFYAQAQFPLDRVLFVFSWDEIIATISNSSTAPWWVYVVIIVYPLLFLYATRIKLAISKVTAIVACSVLILCCVVRLTLFDKSINNNGYAEQCNKIGYFIGSVIDKSSVEKLNFDDVYKCANEFHSYFSDINFVSEKAPFLHKIDSINVLEPFFNLGKTKPNIVLIIVEGLASENSGYGSKYVSATPFIDSLANHSLYWLNCLSVSQRTAGVLPSTLGALPFGQGGFMAHKKEVPKFYSLPKFLKDNDYNFSFYYGGWCGFDDMHHFIGMQGADPCFAEKYDSLAPRNTWGLLDKFLFSEAINDIDFDSKKPRFDVYLTLTSHDPWDYPNKEYYTKQYKTRAEKQGKLINSHVASAASYLYVDEALKQLISDYSKKPGFDNTIFIITGDHNFKGNAYIIDRYRVPLLIWSPMLNMSKTFPAIVTHRSLPPTIISLLANKYKMKTHNNVAWINKCLDTTSVFRSVEFCPQIDPSRNMVSMIYNNFFVYNNTCYYIDYKDSILQLNDCISKIEQESVLHLFELYKKLDLYVCSNDCLIDTTEKYTKRKEIYRRNTGWFDNVDKDSIIQTNDEFIDLFSLKLSSNYNLLNPFVSFNYKITKDNGEKNLELVICVKNKHGKQLFYEAYPLSFIENETKNFSFNNKMTLLREFHKRKNTLQMYIWNPARHIINLSEIDFGVYNME